MIMGHVGDMAFLTPAKIPYHQVTWVIQLFCMGRKPISPHSEHLADAFDSAYDIKQAILSERKMHV